MQTFEVLVILVYHIESWAEFAILGAYATESQILILLMAFFCNTIMLMANKL